MKNKILLMLKENSDYLSGEAISKALGVTRSSVWKYIKALKKDGYIISSVTNRGYKLESSPDIISQAEISQYLETEYMGREILCMESVDSTNSEIKRNSEKAQGFTVIAESQSKGKGRLGRQWSSPSGEGIYLSILLKPDIPPQNISVITLTAGLALCRAINKITSLDTKIKWPNDIVYKNKKLCGILTEMSAECDKVDYVVTGIGINVNNEAFDEEISYKATSLFIETGKKYRRSEICGEILNNFELYYNSFINENIDEIIEEYSRSCITLGREVKACLKGQNLSGTAVKIKNNGSLIIEDKNTSEAFEVSSGEVTVQGIY